MRKSRQNNFKGKGLELHPVCGPYVELYFDWSVFPPLDLDSGYYIVEITPDSPTLPIEYARPNSEGPLHFCLKTGVEYQLRLLAVPHPSFEISSRLDAKLPLKLVPQHENMLKLVLGGDGIKEIKQLYDDPVEVFQDADFVYRHDLVSELICELVGRPTSIEIRCGIEEPLVRISTNLQLMTPVETLHFQLEPEPVRMSLSTAISPVPEWRVRAELPITCKVQNIWQQRFLDDFPDSDPAQIIGCYKFVENGESVSEIRQWGFSTIIRRQLIEQIQLHEWKLKLMEPVLGFKLQLQITSAHRELYKFVLLEKEFVGEKTGDILGFTEQELRSADQALFNTYRHVSRDQSFLELVTWFKTDGSDWQEFQRDNAQSLRWDHVPSPSTSECLCHWVLYDLANPDRSTTVYTSGVERREQWPNTVYLRPFSQKHLFACWDLNQNEVESQLQDNWGVGLDEVGFFLKVHEEFLGKRHRRSNLDTPLIDLFSEHQNVYFDVEPDTCISVEIVARHKQFELALTPVSMSIVTPRVSNESLGSCSRYARAVNREYHSSQREVRHLHGKDIRNRSRVLLHLHLHSPNLYRVDPFREGFLRDGTWPIRTQDGAEVHNPPGEWVLKNCLDSWLPILRMLRRLAAESVDYQMSLDISPPVAHMISSPRFKDYMSRYLLRMKSYVDGQVVLMEYRNDPVGFIQAANQYRADLDAIESFYVHELNKDMIGAFRELELNGFIEISTCTATHGMPAELESIPDALNSQVTLAARSHHRIFGDRPRGIWLAENSFFPGVESILDHEALGYFFVEAEAILAASEKLVEEEFNPIVLPDVNVVAFGRSRLGRTQVWDADIGYAGHPDFREYHFRHMGLPVKRITSKESDEKQPYEPKQAEETARRLSHDFYNKLNEKASELGTRNFKSIPLITCSYDAELFGHHWSEGPVFLEELLREFHRKGDSIGLTTPSHYLAEKPVLPRTVPNPSTWGHEALHVKWSDPKVAWTFREIERADWLLKSYLEKGLENSLSEFQLQAVEQMAAEFIRAQSSDLTFVIMAGDFEEDMQREILKYLDYFYKLKSLIDNDIEDESFLRFRQYENNMFPEIPQYYAIRP